MRALLLVFVGGTAAAQSLSVGAHAGLNLARISSDSAVDTEFQAGAVVGADVIVELVESFGLSAGVEYLGVSGKVTSTTPGSPAYDFSMSYLAFPLHARYGLGAGPAEAYVFGGVTVGALVGSSQKRDDTGASGSFASLADVLISLDLGAGIAYRATDRVSVGADLSYSLGLTDVGTASTVGLGNWKTNGVQILGFVSYRFGTVEPRGAPPPAVAAR
jgi:opacity protein-like surface antigen